MRAILATTSRQHRCRGVSLIDTVVMVSLIGIMSAFALPRFTRLSNGARASAVIALGETLRQAAAVAHAQFLASGGRLSAAKVAGKIVSLKNGYPDAGAGGIRGMLFDVDGFTTMSGDGFITFVAPDAPSGAQCAVTYQGAMGAGSAAMTHLDTRGC